MKRLIVFAAAACVCACISTGPAPDAHESFSFALIGDLGYLDREEVQFENVLADLNATTPLEFVVHIGDLSSYQNACRDDFQLRRLAQIKALQHPFIFTPGDNEWTDCHRPAAGSRDPLERLATLRTRFFQGEESLGGRRIGLTRQSSDPARSRYRENARWMRGDVTFITLHVVGSNNGFGRNAAGDAEYRDRMVANLEWMRQGFEHARASGSRAIMILQQANIFPGVTPYSDPPSVPTNGYDDIRDALEIETIRFGKPVVLVHGDSHFFRIDKPLGVVENRGIFTPGIENFTRVEVFGQPNHHWLRVTVDDSDGVFTVRQRIVPSNIRKR